MEDSVAVEDKPAFIGDMAQWIMSKGGNASDLGIPQGKLTQLSIEGDRATAVVDGEPIAFRNEESGWLVHLATPAANLDEIEIFVRSARRDDRRRALVRSIGGGPGPLADSSCSPLNPTGPRTLLTFPDTPRILLGEGWLPLQSSSGKLGRGRTLTFYTPPGSNIICTTGKYEVSDGGDKWILALYAVEDDENLVSGRVEIPQNLNGS